MSVNTVLRGLWMLLIPVAVAGCSDTPQCNFTGRADQAPSAGCLVLEHGKLLLMEGRGGKFGPPGGSVEKQESAQCGAERETWEETGVEVQAQSIAATFDNGFHLYWCTTVGEFSPEIHRPLEVSSVGLYAPEEFYDLRWRFPEQAVRIQQLVNHKLRK